MGGFFHANMPFDAAERRIFIMAEVRLTAAHKMEACFGKEAAVASESGFYYIAARKQHERARLGQAAALYA